MEGQSDNLEKAFILMAEEAEGLYKPTHISRLTKPPDPLEFYRDYVATNRPVIIQNAFEWFHSNAQNWTLDYLDQQLGDLPVRVNATPFGNADSLVFHEADKTTYFVQPLEETMKWRQFSHYLRTGQMTQPGVYYVSAQNNSLSEFPPLQKDVPAHVEFFSKALGKQPDAVNFWCGNSESVTSLHKDPYDNCYFVFAGKKHFILYPQTDFPFLYQQRYPNAIYSRNQNGHFEISPLQSAEFFKSDQESTEGWSLMTPWLSVDPMKPDYDAFPLFRNAKPLKITLNPGEMLYLPSFYFHHVSQTADSEGKVIAVNYWYDMNFNTPQYALYRFLEECVSLHQKTTVKKNKN